MTEARREIGGGAWVEFRPSGYPFKLKKLLKEAGDDDKILEIVVPYVVACNLLLVADDGSQAWLTDPSKIVENLDRMDEQSAAGIIWKFYEFRGERIREPLAKNT